MATIGGRRLWVVLLLAVTRVWLLTVASGCSQGRGGVALVDGGGVVGRPGLGRLCRTPYAGHHRQGLLLWGVTLLPHHVTVNHTNIMDSIK